MSSDLPTGLPDPSALLGLRWDELPYGRQARELRCRFLLEVGESAHLVEVLDGVVHAVQEGPFVMPRWTFALRAEPDAWRGFCQPQPPPGYHDLMALVKRRALRIEGDVHPLMAHLLYFKSLLASLRTAPPSTGGTRG